MEMGTTLFTTNGEGALTWTLLMQKNYKLLRFNGRKWETQTDSITRKTNVNESGMINHKMVTYPLGPTRPYLLPCAIVNAALTKRSFPLAEMLKLSICQKMM